MAAAASSSSSSGAEAAESGMTIALANSRMIALMSNDGDIFWVTEASARQSKLIEDMIVSGVITHPYELPSVDAETLKAVIEYCDEHGNNNSDTDEERKALRDFDVGFRGKLDGDKGLLIKVVMATNYLGIEGLIDLACDCIANTIKSGTLEEIRAAFDIPDDLTAEEKDEIRREYAWAFE